MKYKKVKEGVFLSRPNRFLANVRIGGTDGEEQTVHVKNTGRLGEIFQPGIRIFMEDHREEMGSRKTQYSLVTAVKEATGAWINVDSQAPNKVVREALLEERFLLPGLEGRRTLVKGEKTYGDSRFDFYIETDRNETAYMEVKGVTLEDEGVCRFPDAPTERGVKHIYELCAAREAGHKAYILFVIQLKGILYFEPNRATHEAFAEALAYAKSKGVEILAYDCSVTADSLLLGDPVEVRV